MRALGAALCVVALTGCGGEETAESAARNAGRENWIADTQYVVDSSGAQLEIIIGRPAGSVREILPRPGSGDPAAPDAFRILEPRVAHTMMQAAGRPGWYVVDLRPAELYVAEGHLRDAKLVPLDVLATNLTDLHVRSDQIVLVYADATPRGVAGARILAAHGYPNVRVLAGGLPAWKSADLPVEQQQP